MGKRRRQRRNRTRRGQSVHAAETARSDRQEHSQPVDNGPPERRAPRFLLTAVLLLGILSVYLLGAHRLASTRSVWSPDSGARLIQVQSVADHWSEWSIPYPAEALDPAHENSPLLFFEYRHEGRSYIVYSFLFALISAVFLGAFGFLGLALTPILGGLGTSLAVFGLSRQLRFRFPLAPMVLVALATPVALYSMVFWEHSLTTGLAAVALYFAVRAVSAGRSAFWFAAGATAGCSIWFHEVLVPYPFALALGAIWVHRRKAARPLIALLGGVALLLLPLAFLNNAIYGTPLGPHLVTVRLGSTAAALGYLLKPWEMTLGAFFTLFGWGDTNPQAAGALARSLADPSAPTRWHLGVSLLMALRYSFGSGLRRRRPGTEAGDGVCRFSCSWGCWGAALGFCSIPIQPTACFSLRRSWRWPSRHRCDAQATNETRPGRPASCLPSSRRLTLSPCCSVRHSAERSGAHVISSRRFRL